MPDITGNKPDSPPNSGPVHPPGLHYTRRRERFDRVGSRRPGRRTKFTVYSGPRYVTTYYDERLAKKHVSGEGVILDRGALGYYVWKGTTCENFKTLEAARAYARGKEVTES